jgi:toxin ParE1/3/4
VKVVWSRQALLRLDEIWAYIAADNPDAATRWIVRLIERAEAAAVIPLAGRVVPELDRSEIREVIERTYRIVYRFAHTRGACRPTRRRGAGVRTAGGCTENFAIRGATKWKRTTISQPSRFRRLTLQGSHSCFSSEKYRIGGPLASQPSR